MVLLAHFALGGERLHAEGHADIGLAVADGAGDVHDGLEPGGARAVRDLDRDGVGHAGLKLSDARLSEVHRGGSDRDVADGGGRQPGLGERRLDDGGHELVGVRVLEAATPHLRERRAQGGHHDNIGAVRPSVRLRRHEGLLGDVIRDLVDPVHRDAVAALLQRGSGLQVACLGFLPTARIGIFNMNQTNVRILAVEFT